MYYDYVCYKHFILSHHRILRYGLVLLVWLHLHENCQQQQLPMLPLVRYIFFRISQLNAIFCILQVDKVEHLNSIQGLASSERRNAELALFAHQPHLAEAIYLQAKMIFRAIELNLNLFNWER